MLSTIEEISKAVSSVARDYGVKRVSLFGSYARGTATKESDIDLRLLDYGNIRGYFELAGFIRKLEEKLGKPVDVLTTGALSEMFLEEIKNEEKIIYDAER